MAETTSAGMKAMVVVCIAAVVIQLTGMMTGVSARGICTNCTTKGSGTQVDEVVENGMLFDSIRSHLHSEYFR